MEMLETQKVKKILVNKVGKGIEWGRKKWRRSIMEGRRRWEKGNEDPSTNTCNMSMS